MTNTPATDEALAAFGAAILVRGMSDRDRVAFAVRFLADQEQRMFGPDPEVGWQKARKAQELDHDWLGAWQELRDARKRVELEAEALR